MFFRFQLFGGELTGLSPRTINGYNDVTDQSLTFTSTVVDTPDFTNYLSSLNPRTYTSNPWFTSWYESLHNCTLGTTNQYATMCPNQTLPITQNTNFVESPQSLVLMSNVYGMARAIRQTLEHYCGMNYTSVCGQFRTATDRSEVITQYIRQAGYYNSLGQQITTDEFYKSISTVDINNIINGQYNKVMVQTTLFLPLNSLC